MKKRLKLFNLIIAMLFIIGNSFSVMGAENEELGTWETKESMITPRTNFGLAEVNGKIYVVGGQNCGKYYSIVEEYDPLTNTWSQKADMPTARTHFAIIEVNDKIYAIGGINENNVFLNTVEEYNPATDTWITKASMPTPRDFFTIAQAHGKIYVISGRKSNLSQTNIVEEYDPVTDTWTTKANIPIKLNNAAAEQVNGKIYVIGGYTNRHLKNVQVYDPLTDTWTAKSNMLIGRCSLGLAKVNGKIYAIGGNSKEETYSNKVEEYNPVTDTWTTKANMPTGRKQLGAIGIDNKVYAIGGENDYDCLNTLEVFNPFETELTKPSTPLNLKAISESKNIVLCWDQVEDVEKYIIKRATRKEGPFEIIGDNITETTYIDKDVEPGVIYYYVVRAVKDGVESEDSNVASATIKVLHKKIKLVLEVNEQKQLSITDDLTDNTKMAWTSSDTNIVTVDANGKVKALEPGDTVVTCENEDGSYTETINVLVVDLDLQLAVDLNIGEKCRLTVGNLMNTVKVTWKADDSTIATVSTKGKVIAISEGLTYITALDETGKELGRIYVRIR